MGEQINTDLQVFGVANIVVVIRGAGSDHAGMAKAADLQEYFKQRETSRASALARERGGALGSERPVRWYNHLGMLYGTVDAAGYEALQARFDIIECVLAAPRISLIHPRQVKTTRLAEQRTWGLDAMQVAELWEQGITGRDVLVGHLDTGVDAGHAALRGAVQHFAAFDDFGDPMRSPQKPFDTDQHGTHTAGTIAGRAVFGRHIGVAPDAWIAAAVVLEGGDVVARVLSGMNWCVGLGVRVLSMPLGIRGYHEGFLSLTRILRQRNILPVFPVGNEGAGSGRSPGNHAEALSVGASDHSDTVAGFSSSQLFLRMRDPVVPDLVAPGVGVISAAPGGGYQSMNGTSMAAAHVAGLAALLISAAPTAAVGIVEWAIFQSCRPGDRMREERAGRGLPNAPAALAALHEATS